jgi:abortive infection bacteriophage resistance protein
MRIADENHAKKFLRNTNYYRFCGYALHYEEIRDGLRLDRFRQGTAFEQVVELIEFDGSLRAFMLKHLAPVEIAFRTTLCYELATTTKDPFWYRDKRRFLNSEAHSNCLTDCSGSFKRSKEVIAETFRTKYSDPYPPCWLMIELASFGTWSKLYGNLKCKSDRQRVADRFDVQEQYLESWIRCLVVVRNACAHHNRVWNKQFTYSPKLSSDLKPRVADGKRIAGGLAVLGKLLTPLGLAEQFEADQALLMQQFPKVPLSEMGMRPVQG